MTPQQIAEAQRLAREWKPEAGMPVLPALEVRAASPSDPLVAALTDLAAGQRALENGDYAAALKKLLPLAKQGAAPGSSVDQWRSISRVAQYRLGGMYLGGQGVPQDYEEALRWYLLAAEQGAADAQLLVGIMYHDGQGAPQDNKEAARWYRLAAEQGNADRSEEHTSELQSLRHLVCRL